ncbi:unnamed protein product [Sympodiomycopsis kandeliae]
MSSSSSTTKAPQAHRQQSRGAVGTITSAFSSWWAGGGSNADTTQTKQDDNTVTSSHAHSNRVPGGWATGYFTTAAWKGAPTANNTITVSPASSTPPLQASPGYITPTNDETQDNGTTTTTARPDAATLVPQIRVRSAHPGRKRTAIPFERSPSHSRVNSESSQNALPSPAWSEQPMPASTTATSSSTSSPRHQTIHPSRNGSDSAVATLSRLKAQSSLSSLKSNSFDNSFATVHSHISPTHHRNKQGDEDSIVAPSTTTSAAASANVSPQARFRNQSTPPLPSSPLVNVSVKPGAPPPRDWKEALARTEMLDSYVHNIVYQSGIDPQSRPIILLSSPALPNPKLVDYDALLTRIMDHMELFVQNDYTVIFFAGGSSYRPPWTWIWSAYRRLSRPFRKNCRRLYICHPTFFTRTLVQIVSTGSALLSPKFARKITTVYTLSDLAQHVDLTQIDIPPSVLKCNMRFEKEVKMPPEGPASQKPGEAQSGDESSHDSAPAEQSRVFGTPIQTLMGHRGEKGGIPRVLKDCVEELQRLIPDAEDPSKPPISNLDCEGLFRKSPSAALLQAAQQAYDRGAPVSLTQYEDPNVAASLLKLFFRSLPDPIFPASTYPLIRACPSLTHKEGENDGGMSDGINYIRSVLLPALDPPSKLIILSYTLELLHKISLRSPVNKMDASNLATVWTPNFVKSNDPIKDIAICAVPGPASMSNSMPVSPMMGGQQQLQPGTPGGGGGSEGIAKHKPCTLGTIVKVCIERYYEIFEFDYLDYEPPTYGPASLDLATQDSYPSTPQRRPSKASAAYKDISASPSSARFNSNPGSPGTRSVSVPRPLRSPTVHSRDGHSIQSGLGLGYGTPSNVRGLGSATTVGRSASGSLRLTKARLGSGQMSSLNTAGDSGFGGGSAFLKAGSTLGSSYSSYNDGSVFSTIGAGGTTSGVALTGANALGFFTGFGSTEEEEPSTATSHPNESTLRRSQTVPPKPASPTQRSRSRSSSAATSSSNDAVALPLSSPIGSEGSGGGEGGTGDSSMDSMTTAASSLSSSLGKKRSSGALKVAAASKSGGRPLSELKEDGDESQ